MKYSDFPDFEEINIDNLSGKNIEVTIQCTTYNQKDYIKKALDSFISQQFDRDFEVLIYDDASTDGTTEIVREYAGRYPDKIKALIALENTYVHPRNAEIRRKIRGDYSLGKYIAICEGDDFWTDNLKLQKQWEALEQHPECDMCACRADMVSEDGELAVGEIRPQEGDGILSQEKVIVGGSNYIATVGLFFRKTLFDYAMGFEIIKGSDYAWQIRGSLRGGIYYLDRSMAAYRRYARNSVTTKIYSDSEVRQSYNKLEIRILQTMDEETGGRYHDAVLRRLANYKISFYSQLSDRKEEVIKLVTQDQGKKYIWGNGRRGNALERLFQEEGIAIEGICDITDRLVGERTGYGNMICRADTVLEQADVIYASVSVAYKYLKDLGLKAKVINMQEYMPLN